MGPISKDSDLVNLIYKKTKIKKATIIDMIRVMPECMAEAFLMSDIEPEKRIDLGGISIGWHSSENRGAWTNIKPSSQFKKHLFRMKKEKKYPLAEKLTE